jgi:hypothetical protein
MARAAVEVVADDGVSRVGEVDADLVGAARLGEERDEAPSPLARKDPVPLARMGPGRERDRDQDS